MVLVHVVLKEGADRVAAGELLSSASFGMTNINQKRLQRYGIVSGDLSREKLPDVQKLPMVTAVQIDQVRSIPRS